MRVFGQSEVSLLRASTRTFKGLNIYMYSAFMHVLGRQSVLRPVHELGIHACTRTSVSFVQCMYSAFMHTLGRQSVLRLVHVLGILARIRMLKRPPSIA